MPATAPYATTGNVTTVLGTLGTRLPAAVDVTAHLGIAHADVVDRLRDTYGQGGALPTFDGDALEAVRWAEAKLAAASVLSALLVSLTSPDREAILALREEAYATLTGGLPGYPPGATDPDGTGPLLPSTPAGPRVSGLGAAGGSSLFPDPYADTVPVTGATGATVYGLPLS